MKWALNFAKELLITYKNKLTDACYIVYIGVYVHV